MPPLPKVLSSLPACPAADAVMTVTIAQQDNAAYFLRNFEFMQISKLIANAIGNGGFRCMWCCLCCRVALVRPGLRTLAPFRALALTLASRVESSCHRVIKKMQNPGDKECLARTSTHETRFDTGRFRNHNSKSHAASLRRLT